MKEFVKYLKYFMTKISANINFFANMLIIYFISSQNFPTNVFHNIRH